MSAALSDAPLRSALAVMLPDEAEAELLRACLLEGDGAGEACRSWLSRVSDPVAWLARERPGLKGLVSLLHANLTRNQVTIAPTLGTYLRAAYFREELRGNAYRRILSELLETLGRGGLSPIVLGGCAVSDTVYDDPRARHCDGIELLVAGRELGAAASLVRGIGFKSRPTWWSAPNPDGGAYRHRSGLPLTFRIRLFSPPYYTLSVDLLRQRSLPLPSFPGSARMLSPADALLHASGSAGHSLSRAALRWACDAWLIVRKHPHLRWDEFLSAAVQARIVLPLSLTLRFIKDHLNAPVPSDVLDALDQEAGKTDALGREIALVGALTGAHRRMVRVLVDLPDWKARLALTRHLILPSPSCVEAMGHVGRPIHLPLYYVARPLRFAARRVVALAGY